MALERYARYIKRKDKHRARFLEKSFDHDISHSRRKEFTDAHINRGLSIDGADERT